MSLANVVSSDSLHPDLGDELAAVVDPERLALGVLPGAGARGAGRDAARGAQGDVDAVHFTLVSLVLPQPEVDLREAAAGNSLVEELVVLIEGGLLDLVHHVRILADNLGQRHFPQLSQLALSEADRCV